MTRSDVLKIEHRGQNVLNSVLPKVPLLCFITICSKANSLGYVIMKCTMHINKYFEYRERGGVVVERRTPNREVLGSIPTGITVLCP